MSINNSALVALACCASMASPLQAAWAQDLTVQTQSDIPAQWRAPKSDYDYTKREVMIPMRDGVKLHTVIAVPNGAHDLPILFSRTPYDALFDVGTDSPHLRDAVWSADREWVDDGYIIVTQDVRGKFGSEGKFIMTRPPRGPLNPTDTDDTTDAYDTIDWLIRNIPESNGRVGMIGSSYDGWAVAMALLGPHPAMKVAAPESPMIDGWIGDDWFHYGAFRQNNLDYFTSQSSKSGKGADISRWGADDYQNFLEAGSAGSFAIRNGLDQLPFWKRLSAHPAYDAFWRGQALDKALAANPSLVPTMWLQGLWDQEDMYGAIHSWEALKAKGYAANNHLVIGPWSHSQINRSGTQLGPFLWNGDTATDFRKNVLVPFFNVYLKDRPTAKPLPQVMIYNAVENHWDMFRDWPGTATLTPLYLQANSGLAFHAAVPGMDEYVSDPAKPVPHLTPPVQFSDRSRWATWLLQDQRTFGTRTDVLSYQTPVLDKAVIVQGAPVADIFATTTGTDGDFVVKVIDVYPPTVAERPEMGGYQLAVSMDIFRGRYRQDLETPKPIPAGEMQEYRFRLPTMNWVFKPGHRIMVQIQSSLFPLYDRNPQTYVPNIFFARPSDYKKATIAVAHGSLGASAILLPVSEESAAEKRADDR